MLTKREGFDLDWLTWKQHPISKGAMLFLLGFSTAGLTHSLGWW